MFCYPFYLSVAPYSSSFLCTSIVLFPELLTVSNIPPAQESSQVPHTWACSHIFENRFWFIKSLSWFNENYCLKAHFYVCFLPVIEHSQHVMHYTISGNCMILVWFIFHILCSMIFKEYKSSGIPKDFLLFFLSRLFIS